MKIWPEQCIYTFRAQKILRNSACVCSILMSCTKKTKKEIIHSDPVSNVFMLAFKMSEETHCNVFRLFNQYQVCHVIVHLNITTHILHLQNYWHPSRKRAKMNSTCSEWCFQLIDILKILTIFKSEIFRRSVVRRIGTITINILWCSMSSGEINSCSTCWWCSRPKVRLWVLIISPIRCDFFNWTKSFLYPKLAVNSHLSILKWKLFFSLFQYDLI